MAQLYSWETLILSIIVAYLLYWLMTKNFDYWKQKGIPYLKPIIFFGNYYDIFMFKKTIGHKLADMYNEISAPYFGIWVFNTPHFVVKSPEIIKQILIKDFKYFQDRNVAANEETDEMTASMLFMVKNPAWKIIRTKMTPAFTSGKIKCMIPLVNRAGENLKSYLEKASGKKDWLDAKEVCAKYATDVITSCAFGIEANSFEDDDAPWRTMGREMFEFTIANGIRSTAYFFTPKLVDLFKIKFIPTHVSKFMTQAFWNTIENRQREKTYRNDLIDIIIKMQKETNTDDFKFEGVKVIAQAAQFFLAGFETTASTISFALYELCINKPIQDELRSEIKTNLGEHGEITYEAVQNMKYLHKVVQETLRKYPVLPFLDRKCLMDWQIPDTNIILEKGTAVYIPMFGLHYDPQYYPNPNVFDPERFSEEAINSRPALTYIPFGSGPRNCIGERFGLISTKIALIHVLFRFQVERCKETPVPIEFEPKTFTIASKVGLPMRFIEVAKEPSNAA